MEEQAESFCNMTYTHPGRDWEAVTTRRRRWRQWAKVPRGSQ